MCIMTAALVAGAVGTGIGAVGQIQSGYATSAMDKYQAQIAANNATAAGQNAQTAGAIGVSQVEQKELQTAATAGSIKAAQGANGITIGTGSAGQVEQSAGKIGMLDSATIMSNAARQAYGFEVQGSNYTAESGLLKTEADQAVTAGYLGAAGSLLGGASSVGSKYAAWKQQTGTPSSSGGLAGAGDAWPSGEDTAWPTASW